MLDPRHRQLLLSALRPPVGYSLDAAVGTTFSLDLIALLTTPLAFAMFDWQDADGRLAGDPASGHGDPLALLESLRRSADRIHIFCQAGRIKVPPIHQRLLVYLERSVIEVVPPSLKQNPDSGHVFHPKVWVLRFQAPDKPACYRLLCLSRNLTFDRSWDTALILDGELKERQRAFAGNRPLSEFVAALPELAVRQDGVSERARLDVVRIADELLRVKWELPPNIHDVAFWPLGLGQNHRRRWPFTDRLDDLLILSPFVSEGFLERIRTEVNTDAPVALISRTETLQALQPGIIARDWNAFALDEAAEAVHAVDGTESPEPAPEMTGLHAKLYVATAGHYARIWTGSANATTAAFNGNVEFLVEMLGARKSYGIRALLGTHDDPTDFRKMLVPFEPGTKATLPDPAAVHAEQVADSLAARIAALPWLAAVESESGAFFTQLRCDGQIDLPIGSTLYCRPISLPGGNAKEFAAGALSNTRFGPHAEESITPFIAMDLTVRNEECQHQVSFVVNAQLLGGPADRRERTLLHLLRDSQTLLRFLIMLLSADPEALFEEMRQQALNIGNGRRTTDDLPSLLEYMLRALDRDPERLHEVERLLEDLKSTPEGQQLLPPGLEDIWQPIARVFAAANNSAGVTR
jgi:hypothetical protein